MALAGTLICARLTDSDPGAVTVPDNLITPEEDTGTEDTRTPGSGTGTSLATIVSTVVVLIFGEISPKSIAKDCAEQCAMLSAPMLQILIWVFTPLNAIFSLWNKLLA